MEAELSPLHSIENIDWRPEGVVQNLACTPRNFVGLLKDGCSLLKYPTRKSEESMEALYEEAARYKALGAHANLVRFIGVHEDGLLFEYCERGHLEGVIGTHPPLTEAEKRAISKQITLCLMHLHSKNFIHCDLNVRNVFVTSELVAKVGDIQGQLYRADGSVELPTMSQENPKYRHPLAGENDFTQQTDLFALGTLLYHLWHGAPPFPELSEYHDEEEIQARYRAGVFPIDRGQASGVDKIISRCWHSDYRQAAEVLQDLDGLS